MDSKNGMMRGMKTSLFWNSLAVATGGALGALARFGLNAWAYRAFGSLFAVGTLAANVLGCLLLGTLMRYMEVQGGISDTLRLALTVGFLGAFTTFSTFAFQTLDHAHRMQWGLAFLNVLLHLTLGFLAIWGGDTLSRHLFS
jgi:CrcB protein